MTQLESLKLLSLSYHNHEKCLYINPIGVNKATAIKDYLGEDFVAFGNDKNDIEMFKAALYAVQVGTYVELRDFADDSISEQQVASKIASLFESFGGN